MSKIVASFDPHDYEQLQLLAKLNKVRHSELVRREHRLLAVNPAAGPKITTKPDHDNVHAICAGDQRGRGAR